MVLLLDLTALLRRLFRDPDFWILLVLVGFMLAGAIHGIYRQVRHPDMPRYARDWRVPYGGWIIAILVAAVVTLLIILMLQDPLKR